VCELMPTQPAIPLGSVKSTSKSWGVNEHIKRCTSPIHVRGLVATASVRLKSNEIQISAALRVQDALQVLYFFHFIFVLSY